MAETTPKLEKPYGDCRRCTVGVPILVAGDENGVSLRCLNCGAGYTIPASKRAAEADLSSPHRDLSRGDLGERLAAQGQDPDETPTRQARVDALSGKGKAA